MWIEASPFAAPFHSFMISCNALHRSLRKIFLFFCSVVQPGWIGKYTGCARMNRQVNGLCRCSTMPMVLIVYCQHPFWLVRACAALMVTLWHGTPAYSHLTDEKTHIGQGHVEATQLNPGRWLWGPWAFPAAQAAPLHGGLNHAGFKDPIIIHHFLFFLPPRKWL